MATGNWSSNGCSSDLESTLAQFIYGKKRGMERRREPKIKQKKKKMKEKHTLQKKKRNKERTERSRHFFFKWDFFSK